MTSSTKHKGSLIRQRLIDQMRIANLADNTQQSYLREIERLARHYGQSPEQLDAEQIRAWVLELIDRGLHPGSTNVCLCALRFFFRDTLGRPDLVAGLRNRKIPRKLPRHLEEEEVERLLLAAPDLRYRAAMLTAYAAGLRISETLSLQVSDIHADRRLLHIRAGKGGHERMAPLPERAIGYLRSYWSRLYPRPASWLFYGKSPDTPVKNATLNFAFLQARDRAGIHRRHTFHSLRHSAATHMHERGGDINVIQDALGHRNAETTRGYARATGKMFETLSHPVSDFALARA